MRGETMDRKRRKRAGWAAVTSRLPVIEYRRPVGTPYKELLTALMTTLDCSLGGAVAPIPKAKRWNKGDWRTLASVLSACLQGIETRGQGLPLAYASSIRALETHVKAIQEKLPEKSDTAIMMAAHLRKELEVALQIREPRFSTTPGGISFLYQETAKVKQS